MKTAGITPIFKKEDPLNKENYRPVIELPTISKLSERVLFNQLTKFSNKFLSPILCGFRKGYSTRDALVNLCREWKKSLDELDEIFEALLMELSNAYDCVNHKRNIAKLAAYRLNKNEHCLRLFQN